MQELQENTHVPDESVTLVPETEKQTPPIKTGRSGGLVFIAVLGLLIALASAAGLVYAFLRYQNTLAITNQKITQLETGIAKDSAMLADQRLRLLTIQKVTQDLQGQLQRQTKPENWILEEVDYLV